MDLLERLERLLGVALLPDPDDGVDDEDEEDDEGSGDDDDDDPYNYAIFSQRMKELNEDEKAKLIAILPSSVHYLGRPFVHHFTKTNIVKHTMVCFVLFPLFFVHNTIWQDV